MIEPTIDEKHYKVEEVAEMWNISKDTVRRMFSQEPGTLRYSRPRLKYKRSYSTLLIPQSVLNRVYKSWMVASWAESSAGNLMAVRKLR